MNPTIDWLNVPTAELHSGAEHDAIQRQTQLTKPPGALGDLETIAIRLAAMQGKARPSLNNIRITVFAGDHGVANEGVSAFPQAVTGEMVRNFANGGAAINVLARELNATLEVINLGTVNDPGPLKGVTEYKLGASTKNFLHAPAMSEQQVASALHAGRHAAERAKLAGAELFIGGEMGIANTTSATALACMLLDVAPEKLVGPGTGISAATVIHKAAVIQRAMDFHKNQIETPLHTLQRLGGFEIAALAGSYIACAKMGLPMLIDGFITSSAALVAMHLSPGTEKWMLFSHNSAEPGHRAILDALSAKTLLNIGMRLGEGSGAAVTVPLLRMACALHNEMATFAEASVSEKA